MVTSPKKEIANVTANQTSPDETAEAEAFNQRIEERVDSGFIPDIRRAVKCDYFYKSFWRDPHFIKLYEGKTIETYLRLLQQYGGERLRILDVGCGAGYVSLELARAGHDVVAIDIAESCIEIARQTLATNPFIDGFGSLEYQVKSFDEVEGIYDAVLFSGALHHFDNPEKDLERALGLLTGKGLVLCYEPCHELWRPQDAAQVALIRMLLSLTGYWYEPFINTDTYKNEERLEEYIQEIHTEYVTERDKDEPGQSPHDNSSTGQEILAALRKHLLELEYVPGFSFIYRLLGGMRGPDNVLYEISDFLATYEKLAVDRGYLKPNGFFFLGRKPG